jgi:hypothetical protein
MLGKSASATRLRYSDLSVDSIKKFHRENGVVVVELSSARGKLLALMLDQRDRVERDLTIGSSAVRLVLDNFVWTYYELIVRLFSGRLIDLQSYVCAADATHAWEETNDGKRLFVLVPMKSEKAPDPK